MTLPSQTARSSLSNARTYTRTRGRRRPTKGNPLAAVGIAGFVVLVLGIGAWVLIGQGDGPIAGGSSEDPLASSGNGTTRPAVTDALSRPVANSSGRPPEQTRAPVVVAPNTREAGRDSSTTNPIDARRERTSDRSPSPLAEALEAQGNQPVTINQGDRGPTQPQPAAPTPDPAPRSTQTPPPTPAPSPTQAPPPQRISGNEEAVLQAMRTAEAEIARGRPGAARQVLDAVYRSANTPALQAQIRQSLSALNKQLILGPTLYAGEPLTREYAIQPGDALSRIATREKLGVEWRLIQRVNQISDPGRIRVGQKLKLVQGPFHAVVTKSAYRMDLYSGEASDRSGWRYIMSFPVGLGEGDSTPIGNFTVRPDSKLINPHWVNPRTGQRFDADDPKNPIGERWIGLDGLGADAIKTGYGIHGTIEPDSIGRQRSMGCVRLSDGDVEVVYELLMPGSLVYIVE